MTRTLTVSDLPATGDETPHRAWALKASLVLSGIGIVVHVVVWTWVDGQQRNVHSMLVEDPPLPRADGWEYLLGYLLAMLAWGAAALVLAFLGARCAGDRPWAATAAGALSMVVLMVPVVVLAGSAVDHRPGSADGCAVSHAGASGCQAESAAD